MKTKKIYSLYLLLVILMTMLLVFACGGGDSGSGAGSDDDGDVDLNPVYSTAYQFTDSAEGIDFNLRYVPKGKFQIDKNGNSTSGPIITMTITRGFCISETEITQELWEAVMIVSENQLNPSYFNGSTGYEPDGVEEQGKRPVEWMSWYDALEFCNILSEKAGRDKVYTFYGDIDRSSNLTNHEGLIEYIYNVVADNTKNGYRLPTEIEWMWAAMGADVGNEGKLNTTGYLKAFAGSTGSNEFKLYAWGGAAAASNGNGKTHQVALLEPNELNLYDMSGNVEEWCWDRQGLTLTYDSNGESNYSGPAEQVGGFHYRIIRGGSYTLANAVSFKVGNRNIKMAGERSYSNGFRIVRNAD